MIIRERLSVCFLLSVFRVSTSWSQRNRVVTACFIIFQERRKHSFFFLTPCYVMKSSMCGKMTIKKIVMNTFAHISMFKRDICEYLRCNPIPSEMLHKCNRKHGARQLQLELQPFCTVKTQRKTVVTTILHCKMYEERPCISVENCCIC